MLSSQEKSDVHFLIVDDQAMMRNMIKGILKANGYKKIVFAETGKNALSILEEYKVDFIIADWNMPKMNGIELLKIIRHNPDYYNIPFLMLSCEVSKTKIYYALEEGVDAYLIKPISQNKLLSSIDNIWAEVLNPNLLTKKIKELTRLKLKKKYDEALNYAQEILKENESTDVLFILSECYFHKKDLKKAQKYLKKLLKSNVKDSRAFHLLGRIFILQHKYLQALECYLESAKINSANPDRKIEIGDTYLKLQRRSEAEQVFNSLEEADLTDQNKAEIGGAYLSVGDIEKASEYLEKDIEVSPATIHIINKYAIELRKLKEYEKSVNQYKRCLKIDKENPFILFNLAVTYYKMKKVKDARDALQKSLVYKPDYEDAQKFLGYIQSQGD